MIRNEERPMIKRIPDWLGLLALLLAMGSGAQVLAQDEDQDAQQEQQAGQAQQDPDDDQDASQDAEQDAEQEDDGDRRGPPIYPTLAASLIEMGVPVVDVRSDEEVAETGTLADAEHIPHTQVDRIASFIGDNTSRAVVLYCGSGRRAGLAIDALRERGYHGLVNAGGYEDLREALQGDDED